MSATISDALLADHPALRELSPARIEQLAQQLVQVEQPVAQVA